VPKSGEKKQIAFRVSHGHFDYQRGRYFPYKVRAIAGMLKDPCQNGPILVVERSGLPMRFAADRSGIVSSEHD